MANYSPYKNLELPVSPEKYNIDIFNKNNMVIDSELHKLDLKNQNQDNSLATKESLNQEILRATNIETELSRKLDNEIIRSENMDQEFSNRIDNLLLTILDNKYEIFQIVDSLPTTDISPSKIYLLLNSDGTENNRYIEYIYINGHYIDDQYINGNWESIGTVEINLDGYVTSENLNSILQNYLKNTEYETDAINFSQLFS